MAKIPIETVYKTITPVMAKVFLEKNHPNNRTISESLVERYAQDIINDRWVATHQGIAFSTEGHMIDGQHRCMAIIKANKPVHLAITTGLPPPSIEGIDLNRPRRTSDVLEISARLPDGMSGQTTAARAAVIHRLMAPNKKAAGTMSVREFDEVWEVYSDHLKWANANFPSGGHGGPLQRKIRAAPVMGAIVAAHKRAPNPIEAFMLKLDSGLGITRTDDPAASLRRHLDAVVSIHGEGRASITYATLRACHAAIHGHQISVYRPALLTRGNAEFAKILRYFGFDGSLT